MLLPVGDNIQKTGLPAIAIALIAVNTVIFILQQGIGGETIEAQMEAEWNFFTSWGLVPGEFVGGKGIVGLITYMFLHGGWMHLIGNMIVLWAFAPALEFGLGRWTLLGFYGLFGIAGGLAHVAFNYESMIPMVGASGAIAGLIGAYTVIYGPMSKIKMMFIFFFRPFFFQIPALVFGIGWIVLQILNASSSTDEVSGGVAWWAHIGGFAAGALVAYICRNETEAKLVDDGNGELRLVGNEELAEEFIRKAEMEATQSANEPEAPGREPEFVPYTCPHCKSVFTDSDKISAELVRCPSADCQRLIYLSEHLSKDQPIAVPNTQNVAPGIGPNPSVDMPTQPPTPMS